MATSLLVLGILSLALAYNVIEGLLGPYHRNITVVDLVTILILGLFAGGGFSLAAIFWRGRGGRR